MKSIWVVDGLSDVSAAARSDAPHLHWGCEVVTRLAFACSHAHAVAVANFDINEALETELQIVKFAAQGVVDLNRFGIVILLKTVVKVELCGHR